MSVDVGKEIKSAPKVIVDELKTNLTEPATKKGIATALTGYVISIPLSFAYDYLYGLASSKLGANPLVADIVKVATPAGIGALFQFAKLPAGNIVAGVGYGISIVSLIKIIIARIKGKTTTKTTVDDTEIEVESLWGVE